MSGLGLITGEIDTGNLDSAIAGYLDNMCSGDLRQLKVEVRNGRPEVVHKPVRNFEDGAILSVFYQVRQEHPA